MQFEELRVVPMLSPRSGNPVPNQYIVYTKQGIYFQSYLTTIAVMTPDGKLCVSADYTCSRTTSKYFNIFKAKVCSGATEVVYLEVSL